MSKRLYWIITGIYWLGIFTLTHIPQQKMPKLSNQDKIQHMAAYGGLGILLFAALRASQWTVRQAVIGVLGIGMVYGVLDELLQIPVNRSAELADWLADVAGLLVAVVICVVVDRIGSKRSSTM